jgi:PiT family inorganic phosphate transporter
LNITQNPAGMQTNLVNIEQVLNRIDPSPFSEPDQKKFNDVNIRLDSLRNLVSGNGNQKAASENSLEVRRDILLISKDLNTLMNSASVAISQQDAGILRANITGIRTFTDYAPTWVIFMISISLGLGTMVGWKRIVKTVGEKIGKQHLTYAQGASAELIAASTIGVSTSLGLPVSTTHVLSSGIAGSMVASKGIQNLQPKTVKNILMAWILTLPVTVFLSGALYFFFRWVF